MLEKASETSCQNSDIEDKCWPSDNLFVSEKYNFLSALLLNIFGGREKWKRWTGEERRERSACNQSPHNALPPTFHSRVICH